MSIKPSNQPADNASSDPNAPEAGTFRPDGSWDPEHPGRTPAYALVKRLVAAKKGGASPREIGLMIEASPFPALLGDRIVLDRWLLLIHGQDWTAAFAATSAGQTIKQAVCVWPYAPIPTDCPCEWCIDANALQRDLEAYRDAILSDKPAPKPSDVVWSRYTHPEKFGLTADEVRRHMPSRDRLAPAARNDAS